ncbi:MAG: aldolase catalytic domain-containing protein [bacterium]
MVSKKGINVAVLDCTIRDGGYLNEWDFEKKFVREVFRSLSNAGVDYFEIGYRGTEKYFDPKKYGLWRFSSEENINEVCSGINGPKIAIMGDYGKIDLEDLPPKSESRVSLFRIAAHKKDIKNALNLLSDVKAKGYETSLQAMGYSGYTKDERKEFAEMLIDSQADFAYVADSYGSILPDQIEGLLSPLLKLKSGVKIGFHPHNGLQMAFANSIEAIKCGAHIIDSSIYGMGRGAGNLPTEIILAYLHDKMPEKFNVIPVLNCIDKYFLDMHRNINWGYQLPYMLSGLFKCHPSYIQKLISFREYTMEDIWRAMDCINKKNPVGYSEKLLDEIINQGILGECKLSAPSSYEINSTAQEKKPAKKIVPYINRHKGETFLILGNGPSLVQYRDQISQFIEKFKPIVMGANYLGGMFVPKYHAFRNERRFEEYIDSVNKESSLLIGEYISDKMISEYTNKSYEKIHYLDTLNNDFSIIDGVIQCNCRTVSVLLMGVAAVMGADKIFAAGMDGYLNIDAKGDLLFYKEKYEIEDRELMVIMHKLNEKFIKQINSYLVDNGKDGINIVTPTSYGEFYKGIKNYI